MKYFLNTYNGQLKSLVLNEGDVTEVVKEAVTNLLNNGEKEIVINDCGSENVFLNARKITLKDKILICVMVDIEETKKDEFWYFDNKEIAYGYDLENSRSVGVESNGEMEVYFHSLFDENTEKNTEYQDIKYVGYRAIEEANNLGLTDADIQELNENDAFTCKNILEIFVEDMDLNVDCGSDNVTDAIEHIYKVFADKGFWLN